MANLCAVRLVDSPGERRTAMGFILSSEANFQFLDEYQGTFMWEGVTEVLHMIWYATQSLVQVFEQSRKPRSQPALS